MNIMNLYFSFNGRIRRLHYWLGAIGLSVVSWLIMMVASMVFLGGASVTANPDDPSAAVGAMSGILAVYGVVVLITIVPGLALAFKRIHDRDRSAVFLLLLLVPLLNLWPTIELLFLDGTPGPNKFGPSPKGIGGDTTAPTTIS